MNDQLRAYTLKIVTLGQEALRVRRDGDWLPDDLALLADELLALEAAISAPADVAAPAEQPVDEAYMATEMPLETPYPPVSATGEAVDEVGAEEADVDDWPTQPYEAPSAHTPEADPLPDDAILVLDVDEEPDGQALAGAIVIDDAAAQDAPELAAEAELTALDEPAANAASEPTAEDSTGDDMAWLNEWPAPETVTNAPASADDWPASPIEEPASGPEPEQPAPVPAVAEAWPASPVEEPAAQLEPELPAPVPPAADEARFCINCGEKLRPGKRFCHRCGTPISEMFPENEGEKPAPAVASAEAPTAPAPMMYAPPPPLPATAPAERPPEITRFCNNCGLGVAVGVTVCPDCGSRDIS